MRDNKMKDSHFGISLRPELWDKDLPVLRKLYHDELNAEHDDVLKREFATRKPCEKGFSKLPKEVQVKTYIVQYFPVPEFDQNQELLAIRQQLTELQNRPLLGEADDE